MVLKNHLRTGKRNYACSTRNDSIIQAQSGCGKTGTFSIASLQVIDPSKKYCQIIILSPTREIADQTLIVVTNLAKYLNIIICGVIV